MKLRSLTAIAFAAFIALATFARADSQTVGIAGSVRARGNAAPIVGATVTLDAPGGSHVATTRSDADGRFALRAPATGAFALVVIAQGYRRASISLALDGRKNAVPVAFALDALATIVEIGRVEARSRSSDAFPERRVSGASIEGTGALRVSEALGKLAGVTTSGDAAAPGGDAYVSLRGLHPGESTTLLDGHPIGPIGVLSDSPDADGTIAGFNFQDAPYFALRDVDVKFGTTGDATPVDSLGGSVDLLTLDPTKRDELSLEQGVGNQGRSLTAVRATGTIAKLGYAFVDGVVGTYGSFAGGPIAQRGLRGTDFTSDTLAALTYHVSGDYVLRNALAKIAYAPSSSARVTFSAYDATSWADKTGEGDNDYNSSSLVLANAQAGVTPGCPRGVVVTTDTGPSCVPAGAYAAAASGPAGGGPGAWQALRNQDYALRFTATAGVSTYGVDAYADAYAVLYHRDASVASGPLDTFLSRWSTRGVRFADEIAGARNALGFDVSLLRQTLGGDGTGPEGTTDVAVPARARTDASAFVHDAFALDRHVSLIANVRLGKSSLDPSAHADPALAITYRPSARDEFRASAGRATDEPALQSDRANLVPVGAINPDCGAIAQATNTTPANVNAGSAPATDIGAERGSDLELGYERRFGAGSNIALTLYDTNVTERIATGDFAAGSQLPASAIAPLLARIGQFCGAPVAPDAVRFTLSRPFNAATSRLRGLEITGRARIAANVGLEYGYDVQSSVLNDLPARALETDSTLANGLQVFGVPLHKASLGIDATARDGLELRVDGHAVGPNNPQQLPGYAYADASLAHAVSKHVSVRLAATNVLGSHVQAYGLVGQGIPYATNAYNAALSSPLVQPFNERYGLAPTALTLSATAHL